ncbi:MAG: 50S ribosomal protein L25 [Actinobacteria bacterium]|nr:50S ribosomal protein L25 [Actinomycetota bacterium]
MAEIKLHATTGRALGNGPSRRIRAEGNVPAVVYGLGADPVAITVEWRPLRAALTTEAGLNALIDLEVDGKTDLTIIKEMQRHPIRGDVMHVDFLRVDPDATITVDVPIVLEGEAKQVTDEGGTVDQVLFALSVNAKPADIPNELTVDISGLTLADPIRVSDLTLPAGVTTDVDPEEAIASGQIIAAEPEPEVEGAEGEAGEGEAEAASGEGDAEAASDGGDEG